VVGHQAGLWSIEPWTRGTCLRLRQCSLAERQLTGERYFVRKSSIYNAESVDETRAYRESGAAALRPSFAGAPRLCDKEILACRRLAVNPGRCAG